jgi:hypothetical protein
VALLKVLGLAGLALLCAAPGLVVVGVLIYEGCPVGCDGLLFAVLAAFFLKWSWEIARKAQRVWQCRS